MMTPEMPSADRAVVVVEDRNWKAISVPARCCEPWPRSTIFAPLMAAVMFYHAVAARFIEETLFAKAMASPEFSVKSAGAFIVPRGAAQMIYLVFDIARAVAQSCGERQG